MTPHSVSETRRYSVSPSSSSNIEIRGVGAATDDSCSASTPPTSLSENRSPESPNAKDASEPAEETSSRRSHRARSSVGSYNLKALSNAQASAVTSPSCNTSGLSGSTLVNNATREGQNASFQDDVDESEKVDRKLPARSPKGKLTPRPARKASAVNLVRTRMKNTTGSVRSVLGKRGRDLVETRKSRMSMRKEEKEDKMSPPKSKLLRELDMGKGGVLDELDLDKEDYVPAPSRPAKRVKTTGKAVLQEIAQPVTTGPLQKTSEGKKVKKWHTEGLYVGQGSDFDHAHVSPRKLKKKRPASTFTNENDEAEPRKKKKKLNFSLPMFSYLEKDRNFVIPYDLFAPAPNRGKEKPKDWKQINKNRLVGEARELWDRSEKLAQSSCVCQIPTEGELGCDYDCLNRVMQYECNKDNCNLEPSVCSNRPFAELAERTKKGGSFDVGVEVVKTEQRGHGIRAARSFKPGQIIMEYTGEIISEAECQRRMREDYKDKSCYYLMELERNLVIDGTRGSMARFINHSCEPNCEVRMIKANGTPRMAVFAGDSGIMTGEELTYDYNFDNFGETRQPCYCGADNCRGYLGKRLNASELKKQQKEDAERKRKAAEMAQKAADEEQRKKVVKNERGASWRGWVPVAEVKAELIERKRILEEQEKNSSRAKRLAARRESLPADTARTSEESPLPKKRALSSRRKTIDIPRQVSEEPKEADDEEEEIAPPKTTKRLRRTSIGSRFTEDVNMGKHPASRPRSRFRGRGVLKKPTSSENSSMDIAFEGNEDTAVASKSARGLPGSGGVKVSEVWNISAGASELGKDEEMVVKQPEKCKEPADASNKRKSLFESAASVVRSGSLKWRQTTIGFPKLG